MFVIILFLNKMISSFYLSRFTADRLGGGTKCIDFVFFAAVAAGRNPAA